MDRHNPHWWLRFASAPTPDADLALFLDGDVSNFDPANIIDFTYFENVYTFADFLDDMILRDQLLRDKERLERALALMGGNPKLQTRGSEHGA